MSTYPHPASFHASNARRFAEYQAGTRAAYCPVCGYTGTFKLMRGKWHHRPSTAPACPYSTILPNTPEGN